MAELRSNLLKTAEQMGRLGKDAAYVAIGLGVVGYQKAQVKRHQLAGEGAARESSEGHPAEARVKLAKVWNEIDHGLGELCEKADAAFDPVAEKLPDELKSVVGQLRHVRDELRSLVSRKLAA